MLGRGTGVRRLAGEPEPNGEHDDAGPSTSTQSPPEGTGWADFRVGYQPAFDGLRGLAISTFILYHGVVSYDGNTNSWLLPGAFFWIELFFVQSGFLITSLLLEERYRTGTVRLGRFYARRAIRLFPALFVVVLLTSLWLLTFSNREGTPATEAWTEVWASLLYVMNWVTALHVNYFPHYLNHFWSLSIEEQFYFLMPLAMIAMLRRWDLQRIFAVIVAGAVASALWMAYLALGVERGLDLGRLYYGTDTRAQGLLIGVAMAVALHRGWWPSTETGRRLVRIAAWIGAAVLVGLLLFTGLKLRRVYFGGFVVCSLSVVAILTELLVHPRDLMAKVLAWKPLKQLGEMAYGLYLWHWPVMLVVAQYADWPIAPLMATQIVLTLAVATASYCWLEQPLLRRWSPRFARIPPGTP